MRIPSSHHLPFYNISGPPNILFRLVLATPGYNQKLLTTGRRQYLYSIYTYLQLPLSPGIGS